MKALLAIVTCLTWSACATPSEDHRAAVRRELLRAERQVQERQRMLDAQRLMDGKGELLPSNNQVSGITLPRGFESKFEFDHEWHYDGQLPLKKLENYFVARLDATLEHPDANAVVFAHAKTRGSDMKPVTVTILPVPGRDDWSRIQIVAPKPLPEKYPSALEIENELAERMRNQH